MPNEQRETDAVNAATAVTGGVAPTAYIDLIQPYPVWAALYECGITRSSLKHRAVAKSLFQGDFETCLDLNDTALVDKNWTGSSYGTV